jgi:hypothetical protein
MIETFKDVHDLIGHKEIDFFINNVFIEYHSYNFHGEKDYFKQRRNNLNKNGYKDYNLVVIK